MRTGMLMLQNPPNDGVQQPVGELAKGLDAAARAIVSDGKGGNSACSSTTEPRQGLTRKATGRIAFRAA